MPKERTHWIAAEESYKAIRSSYEISKLIEKEHKSYLIGALLPDTLLHLFFGDGSAIALKLAETFHNTESNSFKPVADAAKKISKPSEKALLLGVISHIIADITFHPFVYKISGNSDIEAHYKTETEIDTVLEQLKIPPTKHLKSLISDATLKDDTIQIISLLFDPDNILDSKSIAKAINLHCYFQKMYDNLFYQILSHFIAIIFPRLKPKRQLFYPIIKKDLTSDERVTEIKKLLQLCTTRTADIFIEIERNRLDFTILEQLDGENLLTGVFGKKLET